MRSRRSATRARPIKGLIALLGGTLATGTHLTKAGTRAAANTSPEPFSNWTLSLGEDVFVIGLSALALKYPIAAALVVILGVVVILSFAAWIVRAIKRRWGTPPTVAVTSGISPARARRIRDLSAEPEVEPRDNDEPSS